MTILYLVRHAKPAATWGEATDPGLDDIGVEQAKQAAQELLSVGSGSPIFSSPLRRCRETAASLAAHWQGKIEITPAVAEIPSPPISLLERQQWLAKAMAGDWSQLQNSAPAGSPDYREWRTTLLATLRSLPNNAIVFTHYIAINVVIGAALGNDRVINFRPGHASITEIGVSATDFQVRRLGREAEPSGGVLLGR